MRLIDADALMEKINNSVFTADMTTTLAVGMACRWIDNAPTIEERKRGKWIFVRGEEAGNALYMCSACGKGDIHAPEVRASYCWNCGAQMEDGQDEA